MTHYNPETIYFDPNKAIRAVAAHDGLSWAAQIKFMDSSG